MNALVERTTWIQPPHDYRDRRPPSRLDHHPSSINYRGSGPTRLPDSCVSQIPAGSSAHLAAGAIIHVEEMRDLPTEEDKLNALDREWALGTAHC